MKSKVFNRDYDLLAKYCQDKSSPSDEILHDLERETYLKTLAPQMISGYLQGKLLEFLVSSMQAQAVLEVGTFTGYATICMARGLTVDGKVHTIEINPELEFISSKYFKRAGLEEKIIQHIGDAKIILPNLNEAFDLIFLDGAKNDYPEIYPMAKKSLRKGGMLLVDNVLWSGKMIFGAKDKMTRMMNDFNEMVQADPEVEMIILPLRDGLMMVRKR